MRYGVVTPVVRRIAGPDDAAQGFTLPAHGDDDLAVLDGVVVNDLGLLDADVDAELGHDLHRHGVDLPGGFAARTADRDATAGVLGEQSGGHLAAAGVVDADEQDLRNGLAVGHRAFSTAGAGGPVGPVPVTGVG